MPLDADAGAEEHNPTTRAADLLEVWDISGDGDTGVVREGDDDADGEGVG